MPQGWGLELPLGCGLLVAVAVAIAVAIAVAVAVAMGFGGGDVVRRWPVIGRHDVVIHPNHVVKSESVERLT